MGLLTDIWIQIPPLKLLIYTTVFVVWNRFIVKFICWLNGSHTCMTRIKAGVEKTKAAQVWDVWVHLPVDYAALTREAFLSYPRDFISVDEILKRNVTLLTLSYKDQVAVLAEFSEDEEPLNPKKVPIIFLYQLSHTKRLIIIPLKVFYEMTSKIDVESRQVVYFHHTGRCGSTVWSNIFGSLPEWIVVSECMSMSEVFYKEQNPTTFTKTSEYEKMIASVIKFHFLLFPERTSMFIKQADFDCFTSRAVVKNFPNHQLLFGYRNPLPSAMSWYQIIQLTMYSSFSCRVLARNSQSQNPFVQDMLLSYTMAHDLCKQIAGEVKPQESAEWYLLMLGIQTRLALTAYEEGYRIKGVKYERLRDHPGETISKLFDYIGIDREHLPAAIESMNHDSQGETFFSQEARKKCGVWQRTREGDERCDKILMRFGLPGLESEHKFPDDL